MTDSPPAIQKPARKKTDYWAITRDGLWDNNVTFSQVLALCPLLAVTATATNGLGMGLATTAVLMCSGFSISALRKFTPSMIRIPIFVLVIAGLVTLVDMVMNAWLHDLHKVLGLFIPLIVTNCAIFGRAETYASKNPVSASTYDGLMMGIGFTLALVVVGTVREVLGSGTLFSGAAVLLGPAFTSMSINIPSYNGMLLFALPPGGFVVLGFLLAGKRTLDKKLEPWRKGRVAVQADAPACHSLPGG